MRTAQQIYDEYRIMPSLQLHQLRVAASAKLIADNSSRTVDTKTVILGGLFHDMANIIKSDLKYFPEFVEPEGFEYWNKVKQEFIKRYGSLPHEANVALAADIGLPKEVTTLIDSISFSKLAEVLADTSYERKILQYADLRVGPYGILTLAERLSEGKKRYRATRTDRVYYDSDKEFDTLARAAKEVEEQVFSGARIGAENVNDKTVAPLIDELRNYGVA
jgi:hypothetical protein